VRYQDHLKALSAEYEAAYGFGLPWCLPDYCPASVGPWTLSRKPAGTAQSYLAEHWVDQPHHLLCRRGEAWMTTSMLEIESHAWHFRCSHGNVLVAGLGMGMFLHAVAAKPDVERVVVIEIDPDVIELFKAATDFVKWPHRDKIVIVNLDALDGSAASTVSSAFHGRRPDYLYADIWPDFPAEAAPSQTRAMCALYRPVSAGWWGQEVEYGLWLDGDHRVASVEDLEEFFQRHEIPAIVTGGYVGFCQAAVEAQLATVALEPQRVQSLGMTA
jgi:hypothetical protein